MTESTRMSKYLDAGAVDVLTCPLTTDRLQALAVPAYRRLKEVSRESSTFVLSKRNRKLSWVGIEEEQPYAYLREAMVSSLMNGICNPETVGDSLDHRYVYSPCCWRCSSSADMREVVSVLILRKNKQLPLRLANGASLRTTSIPMNSYMRHCSFSNTL